MDQVTKSVLAKEVNRKGQNALALKARADPKVKQKGKGKGSTNSEKPKCTNPKCGKIGHTIQNCWAKGGGAEGKGPKSKPKPAKNKPSNVKAKVVQIEEIEESQHSVCISETKKRTGSVRRFSKPPGSLGNHLAMLGSWIRGQHNT